MTHNTHIRRGMGEMQMSELGRQAITKTEFPAAGKTHKAMFRPTQDFKLHTENLCSSWDLKNSTSAVLYCGDHLSINKGVHLSSKDVTQVQQQRPGSPTVTLTWHACKYKVRKLHQRNNFYILTADLCPAF